MAAVEFAKCAIGATFLLKMPDFVALTGGNGKSLDGYRRQHHSWIIRNKDNSEAHGKRRSITDTYLSPRTCLSARLCPNVWRRALTSEDTGSNDVERTGDVCDTGKNNT